MTKLCRDQGLRDLGKTKKEEPKKSEKKSSD